jgi:recombination protein RecT
MTTNYQVQRTGDASVSLKKLVETPAYKGRFSELLGARTPQFLSSLISISNKSNMREVNPHSIIASAMQAATLDLPIEQNFGFAYIVPYKGQAQFQMGYKGFIQLGMRTGQYRFLNAIPVFEGELIRHDKLKGEVVYDSEKRKSDRVIGYVAYLQLLNGFEHAEYWTADDVQAHAERFSQAYRAKKKDSPWFTDFDAMACKTVLKSLISHWGPLSVQLQRAIVEDQGVRKNPDSGLEFPDNEAAAGNDIPTTAITEGEEDNIPMGDEKPPGGGEKEATAKQQPAGANAPAQARLGNFLSERGVPFDDFRDWLGTSFLPSKNIKLDVSAIGSFDELPADLCEILLTDPALAKCVRTFGKK